MDLALFAICVLIGSIIGQIAAAFLPRDRHDARALTLLVAIFASVGLGWLLAQAGASNRLAALVNLILAILIAGAVTPSLRRGSSSASR